MEDTPWLTAAQAGEYLQRGKRFVRNEIKSGRPRGAIVGDRREIVTRKERLDEWVSLEYLRRRTAIAI